MPKEPHGPDKGRRCRGERAESVAARFLESKGFAILSRNYRTRFGEIDIVAEEKGQMVFVEVRSVGPRTGHSPEETIGPAKQRRLCRAALAYLQQTGLEARPARFDVIAIEEAGSGASPRLRHLQNAFDLWEE